MSSEPAAPFSLDLSPELTEVRDWVHTFAGQVIRPAAAEWDEREETPWPVIEEAAKIGLYSLDFVAEQSFEPSGLGLPVVFEELFWGDAGIGLALTGTGLAATAVAGSGTAEQIGEWLPQMYGSPGDLKLAAPRPDYQDPRAARRFPRRVLFVRDRGGQRRQRDPHPRGLPRGR